MNLLYLLFIFVLCFIFSFTISRFIRTDNKNIDTISAIVNDTNINITQFKIDASVCVKINYSNNFFFKDFHYKNYIVDCNQTFNNDKHN